LTKVQKELFLFRRKLLEPTDHSVPSEPSEARSSNGIKQIPCSSIVQNKQRLIYAPQGSSSKFTRAGDALRNSVHQVCPHIVQRKRLNMDDT
jgi:hypothetical protein